MIFLLSIAGFAIRIWLWMRKSTARVLGRTEAERDSLKETLKRVEKARKARLKLRGNPGYLGGMRDKYDRDNE